MSRKILPGDTPFSLSLELLGHGGMQDDLVVPGWKAGMPLPVGGSAFVRGEVPGPPAKWKADPKDWGRNG